MRKANLFLSGLGVAAAVLGLSVITFKNLPADPGRHLINVSYDPTRELYAVLNPVFVSDYEKATGRHLIIVQSHGGSSRQARKVISGEQAADVVTLGLYSDVEALQKHGLLARGWEDRLPNHSRPYTSTIVFVVRQGNPYGIKDWPDLVAPRIEIVTPDPRTSSNGKLVTLAAWAAITARGGSDSDALRYLQALFQHAPILDEGARGAATTFAVQGTGDVHLTWENEALREVSESKGKLQIVYPLVSILAEPYVAWLDHALSDETRLQAAQAYLRFLFEERSQETIARLGYRPYQAEAARKAGVTFPDIQLVPITAIASDWTAANQKFFSENGVIDTVLGSRKR